MKRTLLIDADIVAYKFAAAAQESFAFDEGEAPAVRLAEFAAVTAEADAYVDQLVHQLDADEAVMCMSCASHENFRMQVYPQYKANRRNVVRPEYLQLLKDYLEESYKSYRRPLLEGDDVIGILATSKRLIKGEKIVVSEDKDLKQIPGWLFNPAKMTEPVSITLAEADHFFYTQCLTGDVTDHYPGCPGIGTIKAAKILEGADNPWNAIVAAYESKGLTEEDALIQARCARILRTSDYDYTAKKPKLWRPAK